MQTCGCLVQPGLHGTCVLWVSGVLYVRIRSTSRTVRTVRAGEALRLSLVVLRNPQHRTCPAMCGFHTTDRAPPQQVCAEAYERSRIGLSGMDLLCTCVRKASKGRHKEDTIPWRWREDVEDQQVDEEGEELPGQEKQPVLEEEAAAAAKAAAAAAVIDVDTYLEDF
eukprot:364282-Chlamydomonas_euryale.AAC.56